MAGDITVAQARALADLFRQETESDQDGGATLVLLSALERRRLLEWVRDEMASEIKRRRVARCAWCDGPATCEGQYDESPHGYACDDCCGHGNEDGHCDPLDIDHEALADHIGSVIGDGFAKGDGTKATATAWSLCDAAGWPGEDGT